MKRQGLMGGIIGGGHCQRKFKFRFRRCSTEHWTKFFNNFWDRIPLYYAYTPGNLLGYTTLRLQGKLKHRQWFFIFTLLDYSENSGNYFRSLKAHLTIDVIEALLGTRE